MISGRPRAPRRASLWLSWPRCAPARRRKRSPFAPAHPHTRPTYFLLCRVLLWWHAGAQMRWLSEREKRVSWAHGSAPGVFEKNGHGCPSSERDFPALLVVWAYQEKQSAFWERAFFFVHKRVKKFGCFSPVFGGGVFVLWGAWRDFPFLLTSAAAKKLTPPPH